MTTDRIIAPLRSIFHLDMDAFFAAVEQRDNPELRGLPLIVGGLSARGVVSTASYEARKFGVHSAMPMSVARRKCPKGIYIRPRIERYSEISREIFGSLYELTELVEKVSIDEAYVDATRLVDSPEAAMELGRRIKDSIRERVALTVSVGIAPCKFMAKIASDLCKPDGLMRIGPEEIESFLNPLPARKIPGVGAVAEGKLKRIGVETIADLAGQSLSSLEKHFGKFGSRLYEFARGIDPRQVVTSREVKSVGSENTFEKDQTDLDVIGKALRNHAEDVARSLAKRELLASTVTLKIRYDNFQLATRSQTLGIATRDLDTIFQTAVELIAKTEMPRRPVRLVGISASNLASEHEAPAGDFFGMASSA